MAEKKNGKTRLVVVESPAKARTIGQYLGAGYRVKASVGHVRDLPERELGVDVDQGFTPKYVTIRGKGKIIQELRRDAAVADEVILATDPDREGEAIAYHVAEQLGYTEGAEPAPGEPKFRRVLFHEITSAAVRDALNEPATLDMRKVEAQQARRILDRLVGYQVSPLLWKPIRPGLSAGRVQTVALRLITEREDEIRAFVSEEYWSITARLEKDKQEFEARLHQIDGKAFKLENEAAAQAVLDAIDEKPFVVTEVKRRQRLKNPPPPFTTSTLQQEAAKRLGFATQKTMRVAQQLYEGVELGAEGAGGLITYMRTDSTRVSPGAAQEAQAWIKARVGEKYLAPGGPRLWSGKKQKAAQDAHEAIRPTEAARHPDSIKRHLNRDQFRLYELIWLRFVAGQMAPAIYDTMTIDFDLAGNDESRYLFRSTGSVLRFDGFSRLYREAREDGDHRTLDDSAPLPDVDKGNSCNRLGVDPAQHFTQPPPRYSEASLVRELEKQGIGRPSTYAQIISTIRSRDYAEIKEKRFHPTPLGETVAKLLTRLFPELFDVGFTSEMETQLDQIEEGELEWRGVLEEFYGPFQDRLSEGAEKSEAVLLEVIDTEAEDCPECGKPTALKWSRHGRFFGCTGYPECKFTKPVDKKERKEPKPTGKSCPQCESELVEREGRLGSFIACSNYPKCKYTEPVTIPGLNCPDCGEGEVAEKRSRRGKVFWSCTRYPDCTWSSWDRPVASPCPDCEHPFLVAKSTKAKGEFLRCPGCRGEFLPENVPAAEGAKAGK
jgi:DNA topoisomerase-1